MTRWEAEAISQMLTVNCVKRSASKLLLLIMCNLEEMGDLCTEKLVRNPKDFDMRMRLYGNGTAAVR